MNNSVMNICMISDNNYSMYTGIALTSLKENKNPDSYYKIYILTDYMDEENKNHLLSLNDNKFNIDMKNIIKNWK